VLAQEAAARRARALDGYRRAVALAPGNPVAQLGMRRLAAEGETPTGPASAR
jgi:hypothetical protein